MANHCDQEAKFVHRVKQTHAAATAHQRGLVTGWARAMRQRLDQISLGNIGQYIFDSDGMHSREGGNMGKCDKNSLIRCQNQSACNGVGNELVCCKVGLCARQFDKRQSMAVMLTQNYSLKWLNVSR